MRFTLLPRTWKRCSKPFHPSRAISLLTSSDASKGQAKNAGKVLDDLHDAAKEGKYDVAQEKLKIVEGVIKAVRAQYSAEETGP